MKSNTRLIAGGTIFTTDLDKPLAEALLVEGDRIIGVGGKELIADCEGKDIEHLEPSMTPPLRWSKTAASAKP